jgi:hypothetical protein
MQLSHLRYTTMEKFTRVATGVSGDDNIDNLVDSMRPPSSSDDAWRSIASQCYASVSKTSPYYPTFGTRLSDALEGGIGGAVIGTAILLPLEPVSTAGGFVIGAAIGASYGAGIDSRSDFTANFNQCVQDKAQSK